MPGDDNLIAWVRHVAVLADEAAKRATNPVVRQTHAVKAAKLRRVADALPAVTPRPMGEAPRDGTKVLAWWPALPHDADTGAWATTWFKVNAGGLKQWHTPWEEALDGDDPAPTHFLPHPAAPEDKP